MRPKKSRPAPMPSSRLAWLGVLLTCFAAAFIAPTASAVVVADKDDPLSAFEVVDPSLIVRAQPTPLAAARSALPSKSLAAWERFEDSQRDRGTWNAHLDQRSGLVEIAEGAGVPWIPGHGNDLTLGDLSARLDGSGAVGLGVLEGLAREFAAENEELLGLRGRELRVDRQASGQQADHFWTVQFQVTVDGMRIQNAWVFFRINNGNLVQWGATRVPAVGTPVPERRIGVAQAFAAAGRHFGGWDEARDWLLNPGREELLPVKPKSWSGEMGGGFRLARVWTFLFRRDGSHATWRVRVDAETGEVVEFRDVNRYSSVSGGYWPVSWRISGVQQPQVNAGWPFVDISPLGETTNSSGVYLWDGNAQSALHSGPYVVINDNCAGAPGSGASDGSGNIDFGSIAAASTPGDCTDQNGINDNTPAARQQYYHLNKIMEKGRAYNPSNLWLQAQITANVNINNTCNAFWNGSSVNFYQSGGGCGNTGEDAGISLHEWGHGFDSNDGNGSSLENGTGETYGDFSAALQTRDSCTGRGFILSGANCGGYGNGCNDCDGVRDIDWGQHADNIPWTVEPFTRSTCPVDASYVGPCGNREGHCESYVSSGALWDFANYDLQSGCSGRNATYPDWNCPGAGGPYTAEGAWTVADRLWYRSRSSADQAFTCNNTGGTWSSDGCNAGSNWKTMRAVDDDDGDLTNGTPHSCQLAEAFDRHEIACTTDAAWNTCFRGCTQPTAPTLTVDSTANNQVALSWAPAANPDVIDIFRNDVGCNAGFTQIADDFDDTAAAEYLDSDVGNGTTYYYQVVRHPAGNEACGSAPSNCVSATPTGTPSALYVPESATLFSIPTSNDADAYVDNCETGRVEFEIYNDGTTALTNVRATITSSDPAVSITTGMPVNVGALATNARVTGTFDFDLDGATCGGGADFDIAVTADEMQALVPALSKVDDFTLTEFEQDLGATSSATHDYEIDQDSWSLNGFSRESGIASSGTWAIHSSSSTDGVCETANSPQFQVTGTSQAVFAVRYDIEAPFWDKANVHAVNVETGVHTLLVPTGRTYTSGAWNAGLCHVSADDGWAGTNTTWGDATFDLSGLTGGETYYLEVNYNTDAAVSGTGFWFDNVRWTDVQFIECDAQGDLCVPCTPPDTPTGLTASAVTAGQVDLSWSAIAVAPTNYRIFRSTTMGGPYTQVGSVGGGTTSFSDTTVTPGVTYYYVVRAFDTCESGDSNEDSATPFGDCSTDPTFGGVTSVAEIVAGGSCGLRVQWSAGTNNCSGEPLVYNVYRSTTAAFTPGPGNLVASCVTGTSWDDTTVSGGTTHYYTVRAEDTETGGGGPCRDGNEDSGTAELSGIAGTPAATTLYSHDFETGTGLDDWGVAVFAGSTTGANGGIDWRGIQTCTASSGTDIFRFGGGGCTNSYRTDRLQGAQPADATGIAVPAGASNTQVTFNHRFQFESGFDGGLLALSLDGTNYTTVTSGDLSGTTYNGSASTACPPALGGAPFFTGTQGTFVTTTATLDNTCNTISAGSGGCAGQTIWISFIGLSDCSTTADGWFLDDVVVTADTPSACATAPNAVDFLTATSSSNQNVLEWMNPSAGLYGSTMIRWSTAGYPADPTDGTLLITQNDGSGNHGTTTHSILTNGTTYYYSAFVDNGSGEYSARKTVAARPFDSSGNVNWAYATGASALTPPAIASIYGVSNDRTLHSMDGTANGVWPASWSPLAMNGSAQARPPVIPLPFAGATKVAFIGSQDGRVYAADADTGAQLWASGVLGTGLQASPAGYFSGFGGTADLLMIGTRSAGADNELIALDPAVGSQTWSYDNGGGANGIGIISGKASVDYANQRVYFASRARLGGSSDTVWALDFTGASATYLWSQAVGDIDGSPILSGGRIYVGNLAGEVIALDAATGAVQWTYDAGDGPVKSYVWPRFGTSEILFSTTNNVVSIEDGGGSASLNWSHAAVSNPSAPVVFSVSGTPYAWVGSDDGSLHQLDISGASPVATSVALGGGSATVGTPAIEALTNTMFIGAENGVVYSVALPLP